MREYMKMQGVKMYKFGWLSDWDLYIEYKNAGMRV